MGQRKKKDINLLVGQNIRFHREQLHYSREKLAELIGVSPRFLADAELGFVGVSLTTLKRLCQVLGVSADAILWEQQPTEPTFAETLSHIDPKYHPFLEKFIDDQLELIAYMEQTPSNKTRN